MSSDRKFFLLSAGASCRLARSRGKFRPELTIAGLSLPLGLMPSWCAQGRTGRCCAGTVYRLVPRQYHLSMPQWEPAELEVSDLAESALLLATSSHRAMRQVSVMMSRCLNPPKPPVVTDAMARLTRWGLLREGNEGSQRATTFGAIVGQLPLSLTAGRVVVIGSAVGLMAPAAVLGAIISTTPQPILRPFGEAAVSS
eukprot:COSAG01_NODE_3097_length_6590_cov_20.121707_5_plen_198_part_00